MAVRVRLRIKSDGRVLSSAALVNTGFETEKAHLLLPVKAAERLGLWPTTHEAGTVLMETAGGLTRLYIILTEIEVQIVEDDLSTSPVKCEALISDIEEEVLINDKLGERLGIIIERMGIGEWRIRDDPTAKIRQSQPPQLWKS